MPSRERATCAACGLVGDDIEAVVGDDGGIERLIRTCPLGDAWFADRVAPSAPPARLAGRGAQLEAALDEAAAILARARAPLVYGLGRTTCETQRAAVMLAEAIGATIDPAGPQLYGTPGRALPGRGGARWPGGRREPRHAGRRARPGRGRRALARRPAHDAPAAARAPSAAGR